MGGISRTKPFFGQFFCTLTNSMQVESDAIADLAQRGQKVLSLDGVVNGSDLDIVYRRDNQKQVT